MPRAPKGGFLLSETASGTVGWPGGLGPVPNSAAFSGTVTGTPISGAFDARLDFMKPAIGHCYPDVTGSVTLADAAGTITMSLTDGEYCDSDPVFGVATFAGSYTITGGTGQYQA